MRCAIYGAGAMGTILGAYIAKGGKEVDLISRNKGHIAALKKNGATICGSVNLNVAVNALLPEEMSGKYDVIFLMTKQRGNAETCAFLKDYLAEGGVVCTTQNGLPESSVAAVLGEENTVGCAISWGATFIGDGVCALTSKKNKWTFALGTPYDNAQKLNMVLPYLQCMGKVTIEDNFLGARWSKLIINSAFSGISAVTGLTFGQISKDKKARHIVQAMLKEGMDTAMLNGVKPAKIQGHDIVRLLYYRGNLKKALSFAIIPLAMHSHKNLVSGMYYDLKNKKCCDMPFICGAVAQAASKAGKRAKLNELAVSIAEDIISGKRVIGVDNLMLFYNCM